MFILGLQGSPRKKGNTSILLSTFLEEAKKLGAQTQFLDVTRKDISPCLSCGVCGVKGFCPIDDDMQDIYHLLRKADLIVMSTPIFFYGPTAQMKIVMDRSQALWSRQYVKKLKDPFRNWRKGVLLAVGATKGENLFYGISLEAKYFFDAVGADFIENGLTYRRIEAAGDIKKHLTALKDAKEKAREIVLPIMNRKRILFICTENACRSQMASAFAMQAAGDRVEALSAGSTPAQEINHLMREVMQEKGIDMAYLKPKSIDKVLSSGEPPDQIITMGCKDDCPFYPNTPRIEWTMENPAGRSIGFMRQTRDEIERKVLDLVSKKTASMVFENQETGD